MSVLESHLSRWLFFVKKSVDKLQARGAESEAKNNISQAFAFKRINCTFALPLLGMECLIKINLL